jgi:hypothetical protein
MPRLISRGSATPVDDYKESRMKFVDPLSLTGSRRMGHPQICCTAAQEHRALLLIALIWREMQTPSLVAQGDHGIHSGRAPRGKISGQERHGRDCQNGGHKRERV